ncbi:hypothetical protein DRO26_00455 [Candidatus Bathyarchaeota archaeon]|nr:MAG: hypothetical protein DRO26_00455 [Candidatus Bathyarchaeota archaeon]
MEPEKMKILKRIPTGIPGLDSLIQGGFVKGSLILVAGSPGSGKTTLASQFLHYGATKHNENGLYVSFVENRKSFLENMVGFGFDFESLEKSGRFKFLDLVTIREEGILTTLETIVGEIHSFRAERLVIDSFTAMAQAFKNDIDVRIILHTILGRITREMDCTTLLLAETPIGKQRIGLSIEEFVADGIIILETIIDGLEIKRRVIIRKMRGTEHSLKYHNLMISKNGVTITPMVT